MEQDLQTVVEEETQVLGKAVTRSPHHLHHPEENHRLQEETMLEVRMQEG